MRTATLKLRGYAKGLSAMREETRGLLLSAILGSIGLLGVMYLFLLSTMVWNIVERRGTVAEMHKIETSVSELELTYLDLANKLDLTYSLSLGIKEIKPTFATRKSLGSLSTEGVNNEI